MPSHARTTAPAVPDTLWFTRCPVPTATGIAADQGWLAREFAPDGIAVRSLQDVSPELAADHHYTHALTALVREGGNVPALWARSRGEETRLLGLTWIEERQVVLVRADSGITGPGQLRGLRLGVPHHGIAIDFWRAMALAGLHGALGLAGLTLDDAELVDVPAVPGEGQWAAELAALRAGTVDAVYVKGALAVEAARRTGAAIAVELDTAPQRRARVNNGTPRPITVHRRLLDDHPELVVRFLAVLLDAADWAAEHPADVARILRAETGAGAEGVAGAYAPGTHRTLHLDLSEERLALLEQQERFLHRHGFLAAPVDVHAWTDAEPLRAARTLLAERRAASASASAAPVPPAPAAAPASAAPAPAADRPDTTGDRP